MRSNLISAIGASLLAISAMAPAADSGTGMVFSGSVGLGYRYVNTVADDPSKFTEYRDLTSSVTTSIDFKGRGDEYYFNGFGENLGRDDQYIDLRGGRYGIFKYQLYDNELRHNFGTGLGARSPYFGIGSALLTAPATVAQGLLNKNFWSWNAFDASYTRQDIGGMFELSLNSPFYFRVDANQIKRDGVKLISGAQGSSPGNGFVDLPSPVDFTSNTFSVEAGYQSPRAHAAVNYTQSKFQNENPYLRWTNGFFGGGLDTTPLPANSDFMKVSLNGNLRQLPAASTLAGRLTYSRNTSEFSVLEQMLATAAGASQATNPSNGGFFDGEVIYKTASLTLNSQPLRALDTRLYWNWSRKDNNSTQLTFTPAAGSNLQCAGGPCVIGLFNYRKNNFGLEAGYRINPDNKIVAGFDYLDAHRERHDFERNIDRRYSFEWRNSSLDTLDARLKYQFMKRASDFVAVGDFEQFTRRFDLTNVDQNLIKVSLDWTPRPFLDFGFEAIYKHNDFGGDRLWLGRQQDDRQEYYASVSFGDPSSFRVLLFADAEFVMYDSTHRVGAVPASGDPTAPPAPAAPATSTSYTWNARNRDESYQAGLGVDWIPAERWATHGSIIWSRTAGGVDFTPQHGTRLAAPGLININNFDDSQRLALNLRGTYKYSRQWDFTGGYAFERYRYSDIAVDEYRYTSGTGTATSYASGLNAFPNYTSNIVYFIVTYKVQ